MQRDADDVAHTRNLGWEDDFDYCGGKTASNPDALGLPIAAVLVVQPNPGQLQKVAGVLQDVPEVVECGPHNWRGLHYRAPGDPLRNNQYGDRPVVTGAAALAADRRVNNG